ncbi:MAG: hypothetical protein QM758_25745 [Armatimonas sp.]
MRRQAAFFLLLIPLVLFGKALIGRQAFVAADLLDHIAPWERPQPRSAWNVLRYDSITEFYPWRLEVARQLQSGKLPLYNPYAFAADGGTTLLANSQSAPLYPLNILFWLTPPGAIWYTFGLSAALHLLIAAVGVYRLARGIGLKRPAALLATTAFSLSGPVVCWLALPTFLCVACWLPWLLLAIRNALIHARTRRGLQAALGAGFAAGMALLAGHLQIAFYVILCGLVWLVYMALEEKIDARRWLPGAVAMLALAGCLAAPQMLPSVELSKNSHRASATGPSLTGYNDYVKLAFPARSLPTFLFPDYFGHPIDGSHWNDSEVHGLMVGGNNYAEWACYVGVLPLLLAAVALCHPWKRTDTELLRLRRPLALILVLALLLAFGTPLNLLLYFGIPGFSQTGSPARVLVIAALALSLLAGTGLQVLLTSPLERPLLRRCIWIGVALLILLSAAGAAMSMRWVQENTNFVFGVLIQAGMPDILRGLVLLVVAIALAAALPSLGPRTRWGLGLAIALTFIDLMPRALRYYPQAEPGDVYPETPGLTWLKANAKNELIAPLNVGWSMGSTSPTAILPPNALTVFQLRDAAGYDSLFPANRRERLKEALGGQDPAPPQNGNMAFVKSFSAAQALGARYIVVPPKLARERVGLEAVYSGSDMTIYDTGAPTTTPPSLPPPSVGLRAGLSPGSNRTIGTHGADSCVFGKTTVIIRYGAG